MGGTAQFLVFIMIVIIIKESFARAVSLDATPQTLSKSGDKIKLSLTGVSQPSEFDWLGVYNPPDSDHNFFLGYIPLSTCRGFMGSGMCVLEVPLVNMRAPYQFRVFRGTAVNVTENTPVDEDGDPLPSTVNLLAVSSDVQFQNYNEPTQIHLALTSSPKQMRVMFVTRDPLKTFIKYGRKKSHLHAISEVHMETYRQDDMCEAPANAPIGWRNPGIIHDGSMEDLVQGRRYYYQVGSDEGGWSERYSFRVGDDDADETHALLFGDMGTAAPYKTFRRLQPESERTIQLMGSDMKRLNNKAVYISHIGDISYARGLGWLWDEFFHRIQPLAAQAPYHVCIGNHEYDWPLQPWRPEWATRIYRSDGGGECGVPYSVRFHMPGNSSSPNSSTKFATRNLYYSHAVGVVHFLYFSTETDFTLGSDQLAFVEMDLKGVDRSKTPFVVLLGHRPMYSTSKDETSRILRAKMVQHLEPLLVKYHVNLVLWGHVHKYERTCAIENYTCGEASESGRKQLPVHVVIGMGGQDYQPSWEPRPQHPDSPVFPQKEWSLYRGSEFGYVRLHATRSVLTLNYVGNHDGEVHDVLRISFEEEGLDHSRDRHSLTLSPSSNHNWVLALTTIAAVVLLVVGLISVVFIQTPLGNLRRYWWLGDTIEPRGSYARVQTNVRPCKYHSSASSEAVSVITQK